MRKTKKHITTLLYRQSINKESKLKINPSIITPLVVIDPEKEILLIKGKSSPEHAVKFFDIVFLGLKNYPFTGVKRIKVHIQLSYFNTSSSKCLIDLTKVLNQLSAAGIKVILFWYYDHDDDDMRETALDYQEISNISFKLIEYPQSA